MRLYAVSLHGTGLTLVIDGKLEQCGFYKHEYVWAPSEDDAKENALSGISRKLASQAQSANVGALHIVVDSVSVEPKVWKALSSPGFVFYRDEEKQSDSE